MAVGITPELEPGICSLCKEKKDVRLIIDNGSDRIAKICAGCASSSALTAEEILDKFGFESKKAEKAQILGKDEWVAAQQASQVPKDLS